MLEENKLYCRRKNKWVEVITTAAEVQDILKGHHIQSTGSHVGIVNTKYKIAAKYYWFGMSKDITDYISTCPTCKSLDRLKPQTPSLKHIKVSHPMQVVEMNLIDWDAEETPIAKPRKGPASPRKRKIPTQELSDLENCNDGMEVPCTSVSNKLLENTYQQQLLLMKKMEALEKKFIKRTADLEKTIADLRREVRQSALKGTPGDADSASIENPLVELCKFGFKTTG